MCCLGTGCLVVPACLQRAFEVLDEGPAPYILTVDEDGAIEVNWDG